MEIENFKDLMSREHNFNLHVNLTRCRLNVDGQLNYRTPQHEKLKGYKLQSYEQSSCFNERHRRSDQPNDNKSRLLQD